MKRIRESLEYPIPFWLSPIFILSLIGFWMIFKWGFESTPDKWEYWKWVIDKIIYIGVAIAAVISAQHIFNKKARDRENRERRLKHLETIMNNLEKTNLLASEHYHLVKHSNSEQKDGLKPYSKAYEMLIDMSSISHFYEFPFSDNIAYIKLSLMGMKDAAGNVDQLNRLNQEFVVSWVALRNQIQNERKIIENS